MTSAIISLVTMIFSGFLTGYSGPIYDYTIKYESYKVAVDGKLQEREGAASLSIARDGSLRLKCGDKTYTRKCNQIGTFSLKGTDTPVGFQITFPGEKDRIIVYKNWCLISPPETGVDYPYMNFTGCTNEDEVQEVITILKTQRGKFFTDLTPSTLPEKILLRDEIDSNIFAHSFKVSFPNNNQKAVLCQY